MATTIQINEATQKALQKRKIYDQETYDEVIQDLIEDTLELSEETKRDIAKARAEVAAGKVIPLEEVKRKLGL